MLIFRMSVIISQADFIQSVPDLWELGIGKQMIFSEHTSPVACLFQRGHQVWNCRGDRGPVISVIMLGKISAGGEAAAAGPA